MGFEPTTSVVMANYPTTTLMRLSTYSIEDRKYKNKSFSVPTRNEDLYFKSHTGRHPISEVIKGMKSEMEVERHGPMIPKQEDNYTMYRAQTMRRFIEKSKDNKWVTQYNITLSEILKKYNRGIYDSPTKGFMWLFVSHALPVGARMVGKDAKKECPRCGKAETIRHMAFGCSWAKKVRKITYTEWWARTGDYLPATDPSFKRDLFETNDNVLLEEVSATLAGITTRTIWKQTCKERYEGAKSPMPVLAANEIWTELEIAVKGRIGELEKRAKWWNYRALTQIVETELADVKTAGIQGEIHFLLRLIPRDRWPKSQKGATLPL